MNFTNTKITLTGNVASPYQLIGAIAAQHFLSKIKNQSVSLNLTYKQYWHKNNVSPMLMEFINNTSAQEEYVLSKNEYHLAINHPTSINLSRQVIIDDGVGAYRRNPIQLLLTIQRENALTGRKRKSIPSSLLFIIKFYVRVVLSAITPYRVSLISQKTGRFGQAKTCNIKFFLSAISQLSDLLPDSKTLISKPCVILLTQPPNLIGYRDGNEYKNHILKIISAIHQAHTEVCTIFIKKHPIDDYNFECLNHGEIVEIEDDIPAEILFYRHQKWIRAIYGFTSTSLLTGKILFNIPAKRICTPRTADRLTGDYAADRVIKKYTTAFLVKE